MKTFLLLLLIFITSCKNEQEISGSPKKVSSFLKEKSETKTVEDFAEKFENYLSSNEEKPIAIINNVEGNRTDINIEGHKIKWMDSEEMTVVKINNDTFILDDYMTLNPVTDGDKDSLAFPNNWDRIMLYKYYKSKQREIIVITMNYHPCTGLGCSVEYALFYDTATKTKNFFGSFRGGPAQLYNFGDGKLCYVSNTYKGDFHGETPVESENNIYEFNTNGQFTLMKNGGKMPYFIKSTWFPGNHKDSLAVNWPYEIR